jgi:mucin-19
MKNVCTIIPPDCPVDVCGCQPGATTCGSGELVTCNSDGMSTTTTACSLGCGNDGLSCATFTPSNGLAPILAEAGSAADFVVPTGSTVDSSSCTIEGAGGASILLGTIVASSPGSKICAFAAHDFMIGDVTASGTYPVAFVAYGSLMISGVLDATGKGSVPGPGALAVGSPCDGGSASTTRCSAAMEPSPQTCSEGTGGGGGALQGGSGGSTDTIAMSPYVPGPGSGYGGPAAAPAFSPLAGGCSGGSGFDTVLEGSPGNPTIEGVVTESGGAGGGAIQLVAGANVELVGIVNVGGGGGLGSGTGISTDGTMVLYDVQATGGGAGGTIVIETPMLTAGPAGGFAANGGGGGGCKVNGADGTPDSNPALGGDDGTAACAGSGYSFMGGVGGTVATPAGEGGADTRPISATTDRDIFGGGGGSVGRVRIATLDGTFSSASTSVQSAVLTVEMLVTN